MNKSQTQIQEYQYYYNEMKKQTESLTNENTMLKQKYSTLESQKQDLEIQNDDLEKKFKQLLDQNTQLKVDLDKSKNDIETSKKEKIESQNELNREKYKTIVWLDSFTQNPTEKLINHWSTKIDPTSNYQRNKQCGNDQLFCNFKTNNKQQIIGRYIIVIPMNPKTQIIKLHEASNLSNKQCIQQQLAQYGKPVIFDIGLNEYEICCYTIDSFENISYNTILPHSN